MNILESLENLNISEETFNSILGIVKQFLQEDYKSFEDEKMDKGDSQSYKELATVRNAIRRNKTKELKKAFNQYTKDRKEELKGRDSKNLYNSLQNLNKEEASLKRYQRAREEEKDAMKDVERARKFADRAKEFEEKYKDR